MSFLKLEKQLLARSDLSSTAKLVFATIADAMRSKGKSWPGIRVLCRAIGVTDKPVTAAVNDLERLGLLVVERRGLGRSNVYRLPQECRRRSDTSDTSNESQSVGLLGGSVGESPTEVSEKLRPKKTRLKKKTNAASRKHSARPLKKSNPKALPDPRVTPFMEAWRTAYQKHQGKPWVDASPAKDRKLIRDLLHRLDADRTGEDALQLLTAAADRLCKDGIRWASGTPSIGLLSKGINDLLPKPASSSENNSGSPHPIVKLAADRFPDDVADNPEAYLQLGRRIDAGELRVRDVKAALAESGDGPAFRAKILAEQSAKVEVAHA